MNPITSLLSNVRSLVFGNNNQQQQEQQANMSLDDEEDDIDVDAWGGIGMKNDGDDDDGDDSSLGPASDYENEVEFDYVYRAVVAGETPEQVQRMIDLVAEGSDARRRSAVNAPGRLEQFWTLRSNRPYASRNETPLQAAHRMRRGQVIGLLLKRGATPPNGLQGFGSSTHAPQLALCASYGLVSDTRRLLRKGHDAKKTFACAPYWTNKQPVARCTAAHLCVATPWQSGGGSSSAHEMCLKLLVKEGGVEINARDGRGQTPAFWACYNGGRVKTLTCLASLGASMSGVFDSEGNSLLALAVKQNLEPVVRFLIDEAHVPVDEINPLTGGSCTCMPRRRRLEARPCARCCLMLVLISTQSTARVLRR